MIDASSYLTLFCIPPARNLSPEKVHGTACVWCSTVLSGGLGVRLDDLGTYQPHACTSCWQTRVDATSLYFEWALHCSNCPDCLRGGRCPVGDVLRLRYLELHQRADMGPVVCALCTAELQWADQFQPHSWEGFSALHHGWVHTSCLPREVNTVALTL